MAFQVSASAERIEVKHHDPVLFMRFLAVPLVIVAAIAAPTVFLAVVGTLVFGLLAVLTLLEWRTRLVADRDGLRIRNRLEDHSVPWAAVRGMWVDTKPWPTSAAVLVVDAGGDPIVIVASQTTAIFGADGDVQDLRSRLLAFRELMTHA